MKKIFFAVVFAGALLGLAACGNRETVAAPGTAVESIGEAQSSDTAGETVNETAENAELPTQAGITEDQSSTQEGDLVEFVIEDHEGSSDPEDKTRDYKYSYQTVTITIPDNEAAQEKIQKDLDEYVADFVEGIQNGDLGTFYPDMPVYEQSYENLSFNVIRADEKVISVSWAMDGYDQGAHGWFTGCYKNYYTQTGELITFDSLGSGFREKALELVTAKAAEMQAEQDIFYPDYERSIKLVVLDGTENLDTIYQEIYGTEIGGTGNGMATPTFGITEDEIFFISEQYVLQSYADGIVDFTFTAEDFGDALTADIF